MANGMPLSATVGRRTIMELAADLWITSTFGGEALSLAAALATITKLERPETLERLWGNSKRLARGLQELADKQEGVEFFGQPSMPGIRFRSNAQPDDEAGHQFVANMLEVGILTRPNYVFFPTEALTTEDIERTLEAAETALSAMAAPVA